VYKNWPEDVMKLKKEADRSKIAQSAIINDVRIEVWFWAAARPVDSMLWVTRMGLIK
jgi:hypothetical protein